MLNKIKESAKLLCVVIFSFIAACGGSTNEVDSRMVKSNEIETLLQALPTDLTRQAIRLHPDPGKESDWQVYRGWPQGEIHIIVRDNDTWRELAFSGANSLARLVVESSDALYLFTYDVERNLPSGRGIGQVVEGIDLWRVDRSATNVNLIASGLSLGGVDNLLIAHEKLGAIDVCTVDKCLRISTDGVVESWGAGELLDYEIVEIVFGNQDAYALVRNKDDHVTGNHDYNESTYKVLKLRQPGSKGLPWLQSVGSDCLPFRLRWGIEKATWSCATSAAELAEVFRYDLNRTQHNGVGDIGLNNSEGRIAWGLVYVLNAMASLDSRITPKLTAAADWRDTRIILDGALELVARQGTMSPLGYSSRRYSKNRTPLLFALHLGRIAHLLSRSEALGHGSEEISRALRVLKENLKTLDTTAEQSIKVASYYTLGYQKGIDFWADGANVPYNYVSGYVHGLLESSNDNSAYHSLAAALLDPLITLENLATNNLWHYWWGLGRSGWTENDNVSTNTPIYAGTDGIAHISYRSMDAMAVLKLSSLMPSAIDIRVVQNLRRLVSNGSLLPFVNQELINLGGAQRLDRAVSIRYARSANSSELQAQVFALEDLAGR